MVRSRGWINLADVGVRPADVAAVEGALVSGWLSAGPQVAAWEAALADLLGVECVVATSSCTLATHVALAALGVGAGDEVVVPSFTWPSVVWSVRALGAICVVADIDPATLMLSAATVERVLSPATRAVVAVDYAGVPCDIDALRPVLPAGVAVVEDAAHAFGSRRAGRAAGAGADVAVYSFGATKTAGVGELGAIATGDAGVAARCRALRNYGVTVSSHQKRRSRRAGHEVVGPGPNAKPSELTCALARSQLGRVEDVFAARSANLARYRAALAGLAPTVALQDHTGAERVVPYLLPMVMDDPAVRDESLVTLRTAEVEAGTHYRALHHFGALASHVVRRGPLPVTDRVVSRVLTVPVHEGLGSAEVDEVVDLIAQAVRGGSLVSGAGRAPISQQESAVQ